MTAPSPEPAFVLRGHESSVHVVSFAECGNGKEMLVSGDDSGLIKCWDLETHRTHSTISCDGDAVLGLHVFRNHLFSQTKRGMLNIWDWDSVNSTSSGTCKPVSGIQVDLHSFCKFVRVGDDSEGNITMAAPAKGGIEVGLWDTRTAELSPSFRPHQHHHGGTVDSSPTGMCSALCAVGNQHVLGAYEDGSVRLWDLRIAHAIAVKKLHSEPIFGLDAGALKMNPDSQISKACCVSGGADGCVIFSNIENLDQPCHTSEEASAGSFGSSAAQLHEECRIDIGGSGAKGVSSVAVRGDGKIAACACWDGRVRVYACKKPRLLASLRCHAKGALCAAFSPQSRLLASASEDTRIAVWDVYR